MSSSGNRPDDGWNVELGSVGPFSVVCGIPMLADAVASSLASTGFRVDPATATRLILDVPRGYALHTLLTLDRTGPRLIVVTWNSCAEHLLDLWNLGPDALLAGLDNNHELARALAHSSTRRRYGVAAEATSPLTPREREVLHYLVRGWRIKRIADHLGIEEHSVSGHLNHVYDKLGLENRTEATLYYWDMSHLFDQETETDP